ncbi:MAG TPA: hypothetical protein VFI95_24620 [Terriglobales bacterium]|nr:hypothetical protein [Terriglobales bacterium]
MNAERDMPITGTGSHIVDSQFSEPADATGAAGEEGETDARGGGVWLHRFAVLLFVFFCAVLGVILIIFPWRDEWVNNTLLFGHPVLQDFLSNGFVRGICSGLGLLDIWIGFWEAVHYHE